MQQKLHRPQENMKLLHGKSYTTVKESPGLCVVKAIPFLRDTNGGDDDDRGNVDANNTTQNHTNMYMQ